MPSTIANGCPLDSFNMLKDGSKAFDGPKCDTDSVSDGYPKPPYMDVPHYKDCLGHKDMPGHWTSLCMPSTIANGCPLDSFNMLKDGPKAFDGSDCDDTVKDLPPTPDYINIPHYKDCLAIEDHGLWSEFCMPSTRSNGCPQDSWNQLNQLDDPKKCSSDDTVKAMPPTPAYMKVPHYKDCLGHKDMGNWVSFCMPSTVANGCPLDSYNQLKAGPLAFDGPACDETVKGMPPTPDYLNVPHYKECLGHKDFGAWWEYCMPSTIANGCPLVSFNMLKDVFDGSDCDDDVQDLPPTPDYINIPYYKDCLAIEDHGLWSEFCMPATRSNGCPQDSWNQLN